MYFESLLFAGESAFKAQLVPLVWPPAAIDISPAGIRVGMGS